MTFDTTIYGESRFPALRIESKWPPEMVEKLKELHEAGLSCAEIAKEIGGISRNAVIGKLSRLGLSRPRPPRSTFQRQRKVPTLHSERELERAAQRQQKSAASEIVELPPDQSPCACTLMQLNEHTCRWPLADAMYCGAEPVDGKPYCGRHYRIAYRPALNISDEGRLRHQLNGLQNVAKGKYPTLWGAERLSMLHGRRA